MSSQRLARQAYTKRWKRARREVEQVAKAVRAEIRAEQSAARRRQEQLAPLPLSATAHGRQEDVLAVATIERIMEAHMARLMRRIDTLEAKLESLVTRAHPPHSFLQEDVLLSPCRTVSELEELDRSLAQQERRSKMQHFLGRLGGKNVGAAIRRILRRVATNDVLAQYSLRGRRSKKSFQIMTLCKIITAACLKNFPGKTEAEVEDVIGQVLMSAPNSRPAEKE